MIKFKTFINYTKYNAKMLNNQFQTRGEYININ